MLALLAWALFAALAPTVLGIDHRGLLRPSSAPATARRCTRASADYPLRTLAPIGAVAGLLALAAAWLLRRAPADTGRDAARGPTGARTQSQLGGGAGPVVSGG